MASQRGELIGNKGKERKIVVYSFQTHFVLTVGEPFMAPVEQYVFAEVRSNIGRFHCREP